VAPALVFHVGPERRDDSVAGDSRRARSREKREDSQPARLGERAGHDASVATHREAT